MIRRLIVVLVILAVIGFGAFWFRSAPRTAAATTVEME